MTCGIYLLRFGGTDKVYVGQAVNIEKRYIEHIYSFKSNNASEKLLQAFKTYGTPLLDILIEVDRLELDKAENEAIEIYNSVKNGFNTMSKAGGGDSSAYGETASQSKYSNENYIHVFKLLVHSPELTFTDISVVTGVSVPTIRLIASLNTHKWLKELFPEDYQILEQQKGNRKVFQSSVEGKGIKYPPIKDPEGNIFSSIPNITAFANSNRLDPSALIRVLKGKAKTHKGWKLA